MWDERKLKKIIKEYLSTPEKPYLTIREVTYPSDFKKGLSLDEFVDIFNSNIDEFKKGKYEEYPSEVHRDLLKIIKEYSSKNDLYKALYVIKNQPVKNQIEFIHKLVSGGARRVIKGIDPQCGSNIMNGASIAIKDILLPRKKIEDLKVEDYIDEKLYELRQGILDEYFMKRFNGDENRNLYQRFIGYCSTLEIGIHNKYSAYTVSAGFNKNDILDYFYENYNNYSITKKIKNDIEETLKKSYNPDYISNEKKRITKQGELILNYLIENVKESNKENFDDYKDIINQDILGTDFDHTKIEVSTELVKDLLTKMDKIKTLKYNGLLNVDVAKLIVNRELPVITMIDNMDFFKNHIKDFDLSKNMISKIFKHLGPYEIDRITNYLIENKNYEVAIAAIKEIKDPRKQLNEYQSLVKLLITNNQFDLSIKTTKKISFGNDSSEKLIKIAEELFKIGNVKFANTAICEAIDMVVYDKSPEPENVVLIKAIRSGENEVAKLCMEIGVDVDKREENGSTAISFAALYGNLEMVSELLKYNANPNILSNNGNSPLLWAIRSGNKRIAKLLMKKGADVNKGRENGSPAISFAAKNGNLEMVSELLKFNANPNILSNNGNSPLMWAIQSGNNEIIKLLIEKGADPDILSNYGKSPLIWAIQSGNNEIAKLLMENGADLDKIGEDGSPAISIAAQNGNLEMVNELLKCNANLNISSYNGNSPLIWAIQSGNNEIAKLLVEKNGSRSNREIKIGKSLISTKSNNMKNLSEPTM